MKLISLNVWGGTQFDALMKYIENNSNTDIFCLQEVFDAPVTSETLMKMNYRADTFSKMKELLPNHVPYFAPFQDSTEYVGNPGFPVQYGLVIFARKSLKIQEIGETYVYGHYNSNHTDHGFSDLPPRNLQFIRFSDGNENYSVINLHGIWNGQGKGDSEDRLEQSRIVQDLLKKLDGKKIVCGDFNLRPDTESISVLEENLINLIKENEIKSTRSSLYNKNEGYADYVLVSNDINVKNFNVPNLDISDHLPMELEFS